MATIERVTVSSDRRKDVVDFLRELPRMLSGQVADPQGVAAGLRARLAWSVFSLVAPNFNDLGRGLPGADGDRWAPLSREYLAYHRPVKGRKPPRAGKSAPGGKDGFLDKQQLAEWRRIYAQSLKRLLLDHPEKEAKGIAAAKAWAALKRAGAKTKIDVFGNRVMGQDYQALVDTGRLRQSLQAGELLERGPAAEYRGTDEQEAEVGTPYRVVVGTNDKKAGWHHNGKGRRRRRLWPEQFPSDWWRQILSQLRGGLMRIGDLFREGKL